MIIIESNTLNHKKHEDERTSKFNDKIKLIKNYM